MNSNAFPKDRCDLFVSYAEADCAWVEGYLLDALQAAGVRVHSREAFRLGRPLLLDFEEAIKHSRRVLLVISEAYLAESTMGFVDLMAQTYGLETDVWPVIPLILQPVELPPRLAVLEGLDATDPEEWPGVVARLCADLAFEAPGPTPRPPCPYPGMASFQVEDKDRFFGRGKEAQALLLQLRKHPFLTTIGPSGSGKSSLVFAGLVPTLQESGLFGPGGWLVRSLRPGESPLAALDAALDGTKGGPAQAVADLLAAEPEAGHMLLVVDQFEELFTRARKEEQEPFQQALLRLASISACYVVLTVRADFYPDLMASPLWPEIQAHRAEVLPLDETGLRQAIVRPAEGVGVLMEATLVERLLKDAAGEPGILPLLQETLVLLWEKVERRYLAARAYVEMGSDGGTGLQAAMAYHADGALGALTKAQQAIGRRIFLRLVHFGQGRADTRRQQRVAELRAAEDDPVLFEQTLHHLASNRLITLSGEEKGTGRRADIAHEALIAGWPALSTWVAERRGAEKTRRRLEAKAAEWQRMGQGSGGLLDQIEMLEAERWLDSPDAAELGYSQDLNALVEASRAAIEAAEREKEAARQRELELERRSRRRLLGVVIILGLLVLVGAGWLARQEYLRQRARAAGILCPEEGLAAIFECAEVTNSRYELCVEAGRCSPPPAQLSAYFWQDGGDMPVTGVDAMQAATFCQWIGRRLPTRVEWLAVATQGGEAPWPWDRGDPTPEHANLLYDPDCDDLINNPLALLRPVGGRPEGVTPGGICDLIGNVWEWTATPCDNSGREGERWDGDPATAPNRLVIEGGSYRTSVSGLGTTSQPIDAGHSYRAVDLGFRCVKGGEGP